MPTWLQRILRWEPGIALSQWIYDRIANNWAKIVSFGGGAVMLYLATITEWLRALGPAGIGGVAILTMLLTWLAIAGGQLLRSKARVRREEAFALQKWKDQVDTINPLAATFNNQRIKISDLAHPVSNSISGKRFTDCELIGPSNLVFLGSGEVIGVTFSNCDIVVLKSGKINLHNAIRFDNNRLYGGHIWNCTLIIPPSMMQIIKDMGASAITLTGDQELDSPKPSSPEAETQP